MAIPIVCTVCRTSMKISEGLSEQKKIRCSGCGTIIMVTPDPSGPGGVSVSYPRKKDKISGLTETQKRILLYSAFGVVCLFFAYVLWLSNATPSDKGAVEGTITLDGAEMMNGTITFTSMDGKGAVATATIARGQYSISARNGAGLGLNKVTVHSREKSG